MGAVSTCLLVFLVIHYAAASGGVYRAEGDACGPDDNWTCRSIKKCSKLSSPIQFCSVSGGIPIVCCPPSPSENRAGLIPAKKPKKRISQIMCEKYANYVFVRKPVFGGGHYNEDQCGRLEEPLVVGGKDAKLKEFPHMAQIGYKYRGQIFYVCGGSLISERWVLSAAHCSESDLLGKAELVRLGELDTTSETDGASPEVLRIVQRINHEGWNELRLYDDISLYKLERDVKLTPYIRPICLQVEDTIKGKAALATGWGHTKWEGQGSPMLKKVWLDLVDNETCHKVFGTAEEIPDGILGSKQMCTYGKGVKDTCQGDSGGPLQIPITSPYCMYSQVGVTSFGYKCASSLPGVYSRVSHYIPWIEKHVWPDQA